MEKLAKIYNVATGIGSMPHTDAEYVTGLILDKCPDLPFWPQLAQISPRESMFIQYSENLPCIKPDLDKKSLYFDNNVNKEEALAKFYEELGYNRYEYFKISEEYSRGFYALLAKAKTRPTAYIKGQVVGPITLAASIVGEDSRPLIFDEMMCDALMRGLAMKGIWQAKKIKEAKKFPVIFFDEPYLSSLGSAFFAAGAEQIKTIINNLVSVIREHEDFPIGIHCCGNTDWPMLLETNIDILNFDAFGFGKYFILYADKINSFLKQGKIIAWGITPTTEFTKDITSSGLKQRLKEIFDALEAKGIDRTLLRRNVIITPSCGMGLLSIEAAEKVLALTAEFNKEVICAL